VEITKKSFTTSLNVALTSLLFSVTFRINKLPTPFVMGKRSIFWKNTSQDYNKKYAQKTINTTFNFNTSQKPYMIIKKKKNI